MPIESLHTHTTASDGKLTHREMFELSESLGVSVVAFTDHDALISGEAKEYLESVRDSKTKWISGIEISSAPPKEISDMGKGGLHVIGLFVDPENVALKEHCRKAQLARVERMQKMVKNLHNLGFLITEEDCLEASKGEMVGRPHIVDALKAHPENQKIMDALREEMRTAGETNPEIKEKYEKMMEQGEYQHPFSLLLGDDAFRPTYESVTYAPDLDESAKLIRDAGGIISVAHYFTVKKKMPFSLLRKIMEEKRIDAVETIYGLFKTGTSDEPILEEEKKILRGYAKETGLFETGGPDAHREEDMRKYVENKKFSEPSIGLTQKILESGRVNIKHSSFDK